MNMQLRKFLKIIEDKLLCCGYRFRVVEKLGFYGICKVEDSEKDASYDWFRISFASLEGDNYPRNMDYFQFTVEPCLLSVGKNNKQLSYEDSFAIWKDWGECLKVCNYINNLNVVGRREEVIECLIDIHKKRRKKIS